MSGVKQNTSGYLAWTNIISSIHPFAMLLGISELQPRRVSWNPNIIGAIARERRLKLNFLGRMTQI